MKMKMKNRALILKMITDIENRDYTTTNNCNCLGSCGRTHDSDLIDDLKWQELKSIIERQNPPY